MKTYTPRIEYRHPGLTRDPSPWSTPIVTTRTIATLPTGYANHAPATRLPR